MNKKKLINTLYRKYDSELTDEDLLLGESYRSYVSNVADGLTSSYGAATKVNIIADKSKDSESAFTDGDSITVNAWCDSYEENIKDLKERHWCVLGRIVHECGHLLWTNFKLAKRMSEEMMNGKVYPAPSQDTKELEDYLYDHPEMKGTLISLTHEVANRVEDGFIEKLLVVKFPGYGQYLKRNRQFLEKKMLTVKDMRNKNFDDISIITSLILCQAKFYHVAEFGDEKDSEVAKTFYQIREYVNTAVNEMSSYHRMARVNDIVLKIFALIKDKSNKQNQNQQSNSQQQNSQGNSQDSQSSNDPSTGNENKPDNKADNNQSQENKQDSQSQQQGQDQQQGQGQQGNGPSIEQQLKQLANNLKSSVPSDNTSHNNSSSPKADSKASKQLGSGDGKSDNGSDNMTDPKSDSKSSSTLDKIKKDEVEKKVEKAVEQQIQEELKKEASQITKSDFHRGIPSSVGRAEASSGEGLYNAKHEELDILARRMMKNLLKEIKDRQLGDALDGNYFGNRLDTNSLYRRDKKLYIRDILPEDVPDMEVSILVDCSGSMGGEKLDVAIKTAYTVWKFCQLLKIPVTVVGHNTSGHTVNLKSVADGDSIDGKDGMRIFSLEAHGCNRDGYALRFALNKLSKSQATDRIMFVISDGQPNHDGYHAPEGKADIRDAVAKAKKDGISVITAGIGSAAPAIRALWIEGVSAKRAATFLELEENLERLPKTFVSVIKKQLELTA